MLGNLFSDAEFLQKWAITYDILLSIMKYSELQFGFSSSFSQATTIQTQFTKHINCNAMSSQPLCSYMLNSVNFSAIFNHYLLRRFSTSRTKSFNFFDNIHPINNFSKHNMGPIQPFSFCRADEKLGSIRIWAGVCHRENAG